MKKTFTVDVINTVEVTLDMDIYDDKTIDDVIDFWSGNDDVETKEEKLQRIVEMLASDYLYYRSYDLEGFAVNGQKMDIVSEPTYEVEEN